MVRRYFESNFRQSGTVIQNKPSRGWVSRWWPCPGLIPARPVLCPVHWRKLLRGSWTCRRKISVPTAPRPGRERRHFSEESMGWAHMYLDSSGLRRKWIFFEQQWHFDHWLGGSNDSVHIPVFSFFSREMTSHSTGKRIDYLNIVLTPPSHFTQREWMAERVSASTPNLRKHSNYSSHVTPCWVMLPSCWWKAAVLQYLSVYTSQLQTVQGNSVLSTLWTKEG